jgi:hypothetical protein
MPMSVPNVGEIISGVAFRDCIHVAVYPVEAACPIRPGSHVRLTPSGTATWVAPEDADGKDVVGVADPFLREMIERGQRFYIFVRPGIIEHLRHSWRSSYFKAKAPVAANE